MELMVWPIPGPGVVVGRGTASSKICTPAPLGSPLVMMRATARVCGVPGMTLMSPAYRGPKNASLESGMVISGVSPGSTNRCTTFVPLSATYRNCASSESARVFGSLPANTVLSTAPVAGFTATIELPLAPALLGTETYMTPWIESQIRSLPDSGYTLIV